MLAAIKYKYKPLVRGIVDVRLVLEAVMRESPLYRMGWQCPGTVEKCIPSVFTYQVMVGILLGEGDYESFKDFCK